MRPSEFKTTFTKNRNALFQGVSHLRHKGDADASVGLDEAEQDLSSYVLE